MFALGLIILPLWLNHFSFVTPFDLGDLPTIEEFTEEPVNLAERIVQGQEADIEDHPYQVSFIVNNSYFCGGSIISKNYILTAGHCAQNVDPSTVVLRAGSSWRRNGTIIPIAEVIAHPEYDDPAFDKDVAVMKTVSPMEFSDTMQPVLLPPKGKPMEPHSMVTVSGWGRAEQGASSIPERLMSAEVPVVPYWQCYLAYFTVITRNMWCGGDFIMGGKSTCQGDSGGAAVQNGTALGIVSFGRGCGQRLAPSAFAYIGSDEIWEFIANNTKGVLN